MVFLSQRVQHFHAYKLIPGMGLERSLLAEIVKLEIVRALKLPPNSESDTHPELTVGSAAGGALTRPAPP
jgi:hypothetical protein